MPRAVCLVWYAVEVAPFILTPILVAAVFNICNKDFTFVGKSSNVSKFNREIG
jgi:hypothetical protein